MEEPENLFEPEPYQDPERASTQAVKVIIPSPDLPLNFDEEKRMMEYIIAEFEACKESMGWMGDGQYSGYLQMLDEAQKEYEGDFTHRESQERYGVLFRTFNFSENSPREVIQTSKARLNEQLINGDKFASMRPENEKNQTPELKAMDEHLDHQLKLSEAQSALRDGIEGSGVTGSGIMKIALTVEDLSGYKTSKLWIAPAQTPGGATAWLPVTDSQGGEVWADDKWEQHPQNLQLEVLARDPNTTKPEGAKLSDEPVQRPVRKERKRLNLEKCAWQDCFCRLTEPNIHAAVSFHQAFEWYYDTIWGMIENSAIKLTPEQEQWKKNLRDNPGPPPTGSKVLEPHRKEKILTGETNSTAISRWPMVESWFRFDPKNDGKVVELYCLWEAHGKWPIYYTLMEKASDTGKRPYENIVIIKRANRWTGIGWYEFLKELHLCIDRARNRIEVREGSGGRVDIFRPEKLPQVMGGKPFRPGAPTIWEADESVKDLKDIYLSIPLPPVNEGIWKLLEHDRQRVTVSSGTMMPAEQVATPTGARNNTATFVNQQATESETRSNDNLQNALEGILATLRQCAMAVFRNFDAEDAAEHLSGEKVQAIQKWLEENPVERLMHHVRLMMSKMRNLRQLQSNQQAWNLFKEWAQMFVVMPEMAIKAIPLMKQMLEALDIQGVEALFDMTGVLQDMQARMQQQQQQQGQAQNVSPPTA
jgi:hypothetical protein